MKLKILISPTRFLQNQLLKDTDYMSMWHGLEVRVPFLDKEVMQLARQISPEVKYNGAMGKHLLIKAFEDILPREIWEKQSCWPHPSISMRSKKMQYNC